MANIQSQIKRNRQNVTARERNKAVRSRVRTEQRKFAAAVESGDKEAAAAQMQVAARELDRAVTKGVLHKNNASNKKSRMAKRVQAL